MRTGKDYSELTIAKVATIITCVLAEARRQAEEWPSSVPGAASGGPWLEAVGLGKLQDGRLEAGCPM